MQNMAVSQLTRWLAAVLGCALAFTVPTTALAQDREVGRQALDPADQENLPPSIDGRTDAPEEVDPQALEDFREPLEPYGAWVEDERYGTVWVPDARAVGPDFYPYSTGGRWELTPEGDWLWVSDYAWGDIPFHYGRWVWIEGRGWSWIPGRVWAPAWVVWRTGPSGYIGWAPCPPTWTWWYGSAYWLWWPPPAAYVFVETRHVFHHHVHHRTIREPARARHAAQQTTPQRTPARPGSPTFDRNRPSSPDLAQIRYQGPKPPVTSVRRPPELARGPRSGDGGPRGVRPQARGRDGAGDIRRAPQGEPAARPGRPSRWSTRTLGGERPSRGVAPRWDRPSRGPAAGPSRGPSAGPSRGPAIAPWRGPSAPAGRPDGVRPGPAPRGGGPSDAGPTPRPSRAPAADPPSRYDGPRDVPAPRAPRIDAPRPSAPPSLQRAPSRGPAVAPVPPRAAPRPGGAGPRRGGRIR